MPAMTASRRDLAQRDWACRYARPGFSGDGKMMIFALSFLTYYRQDEHRGWAFGHFATRHFAFAIMRCFRGERAHDTGLLACRLTYDCQRLAFSAIRARFSASRAARRLCRHI